MRWPFFYQITIEYFPLIPVPLPWCPFLKFKPENYTISKETNGIKYPDSVIIFLRRREVYFLRKKYYF